MTTRDDGSPQRREQLAVITCVAVALLLGLKTFGAELPAADGTQAQDTLFPPARSLSSCELHPAAYWRGTIRGAASFDLDWKGENLACAGSPRPGGHGLRLFFSGTVPDSGQKLLIVVGIGAPLEELAGGEWPASVTLIEEASSTFFHAAEGRCFTRIDEASALSGGGESLRVSGVLYCAGALAAVNANHTITLGDSHFAGRLDAAAP